MNATTSPGLWSSVAALPDYLLLLQTRQLARHEQALQILVLDHLREIEARQLHLTRGYGSLFDYVVRELGYTAAAAWRRIKAMRLSTQIGVAGELLRDGSLKLSNAAQLQNLFERSDRNHGRQPPSDGTAREPAPASPMRAGERDPAPAGGPVLDAAAREKLVRQAVGKSTREVQQMLAEVDPELAQSNDRLRALGGGRWELKAAVDAECRHGLEKLQMLLSHQDPHLTLGGLVARLVRDGLHRYDPERPRQARRPGGRRLDNGARTTSAPGRNDTEAVQRSVARATGSAAERRSEVEQDASPAAGPAGAPGPSVPKRHADVEHGSTRSAPTPNTSPAQRHSDAEVVLRVSQAMARDGDGQAASASKRHMRAERGRTKSEAVPRSVARATGGSVECRSEIGQSDASFSAALAGALRPSAPKRHADGGQGSAKSAAVRETVRRTDSGPNRPSDTKQGSALPAAGPIRGGRTDSPAKRQGQGESRRPWRAAVRESGGCADSAPKRVGHDEDAPIEQAERRCGTAKAAPGSRRDAERSCGQPKAAHDNGGPAGSPPIRQRRSAGDGRSEGKCSVPGHAAWAAEPHFGAGEHSASWAPAPGRLRFTTSAAKRLEYAAGYGAVGPAERSPAVERHLAALSCVGALPGSRSRYVPAAVKREVWRRDQGRCSYVDPHSGRRCGSRYRLEIDHIVPFALGGATEPGNLRIRCRAHHRYRHAQRHAHPRECAD